MTPPAAPAAWPDLAGPGRTVAVVGASLAGLTAARELRTQGFTGRIRLIGAEPHRPYDRPPLSKEFLGGEVAADALSLECPEDDALDLDWVLGRAAVALDPRGRRVVLADGSEVTADAVVLATGAHARVLPGTAGVPGVHVLRSLDDAVTLREALTPGARLVVVGAGFIGSEVASTALTLGCEVTVVEAETTPLARVLGDQMGAVLSRWHPANGARLRTGTVVAGVHTHRSGGRLRAVELTDGSLLEADVAVIGAGSVPATAWLHGSGIDLGNGVLTDARCATSVPGVVAVGDCAGVLDPATALVTREEHWTAATTRPAVAVATLLSAGTSTATVTGIPYIWSDQYRQRLQFAGRRVAGDEVEVVEGDPEAGAFLAVYRRGTEPVAVLAVSSPRSFTRWRRQLAAA